MSSPEKIILLTSKNEDKYNFNDNSYSSYRIYS